MSITISNSEKRVLQSLHLQGSMGKCGRLNLQQRRNLLQGLIEKGLLDNNGNVTKLGIEMSI
jgi:hypothetical protein